jgi:hypothetical protein
MTKDDVIRMAREAGVFTEDLHCVTVTIEIAERFAALVSEAKERELLANIRHHIVQAEERGAAAEREACAKVCASMDWNGRSDEAIFKGEAADECAAAIRARSNS